MNYPVVEIGKHCIQTEQFDPRVFPDRPFQYIDISSIDKDSKLITSTTQILGKDAPSRARKQVHHNDVLVSSVRPNLNAVAMVPEELDGEIASTGFCVLRPDPDALVSRFLFYRTMTKDFIEYLTARVRGAHYPAVTDSVVKEAPIPLPLPSEQRRIVEILDQANDLRKKRDDADAVAARIVPALFVKMFGNPATNPMGWEKSQLGDVIIETQYGTSVKANTEGKGVVVIRMNNIDNVGYLDLLDLKHIVLPDNELQRQNLEVGDLLFNRTNSRDLVGKTGLWHGGVKAVAASYLIRVRVNRKRVLPEFVWAYMNTPFMKQMLFNKARRAIGMANINATELRSFPVIIPDIDVQGSFVERLTNLNKLNMSRLGASEKINQLFNVLLRRAFSGELTAKWREAHMKELLSEIEAQSKTLAAADP